jgi:uncharacterized protein (DUF849 family)
MRRRRRRLGTTASRRAAQACLNGGRSPDQHPRVPITPGELAADGAAAVIAGAEALHVHPRDGDGDESMDREDVAATLTALRDIVRVPVSVTTSPATLPDPGERLDAVRRWTVVPDFASVNFHEDGAIKLAEVLLDIFVGVEAGVRTPEAAETLVSSGLAARCHCILIEPREQVMTAARATVRSIEQTLDGVAPDVPRLLHGYEGTTWELVAEAGRLGYDTRMGFEDTIRTPDGMIAHDNGELIRLALTLHREAELDSDVIDVRPAIPPGAFTGPGR